MSDEKKDSKVKLTRIVQIALLPEDTDKLEALKVNITEYNAQLKLALDNGWCIEQMKDKKEQGYVVLCKCSGKDSVNAGIGFYARGSTPFAANVCGLYKISMLGEVHVDTFLSSRGTQNTFG